MRIRQIALKPARIERMVFPLLVGLRTRRCTLIAIGIAMAIFSIFTSLLTWVRQYLVLHTGMRGSSITDDAVGVFLTKFIRRSNYHSRA